MRKNIFLISLFILPFLLSTAQEKSRVGFKAGVGFYRQNYKLNGDQRYFDFKPTIIVGLFKEISLNNFVNFQPELMFIAMGGKDGGTKINADYIALPLLFKFHGKRIGFVVGPQTSLLLSAKTVDEFDSRKDVKDTYKSVDIAMIGGIELSFAKNERGIVGVRYQSPINSIWKDSPPKSFLKNNGVQVYLGFRL